MQSWDPNSKLQSAESEQTQNSGLSLETTFRKTEPRVTGAVSLSHTHSVDSIRLITYDSLEGTVCCNMLTVLS